MENQKKEIKQKIIKDLKRIVKKEDCRAGEACGSEELKKYIKNLESKKAT